jgi:hypothetical protein
MQQLGRLAPYRSIGVRRGFALVIGAAALLIAIAYLPGRFRAVDAQVSEFAALSPTDRVLRAARGTDVDTGLFVLARRVIPPGAPYFVATGPGVGVSTPVTYSAAGGLVQLFLLPRIEVGAARLARYVISYGGDLRALGVRIGTVWTYKPGLSVAEVLR